jgi:hypothetical protein
MRTILFIMIILTLGACVKKAFTLKSPNDLAGGQPAFVTLDQQSSDYPVFLVENERFIDPVFLQKAGPDRWCFIPPVTIRAGENLRLKGIENPASNPCQVKKDKEHVLVCINDREILRYALATQFPPDTMPDYYERSGFIHPLKTIKGAVLTADFPQGHAHQHGIFHAWTRSHVRDSMIDFWNQQAGLGNVRHKELLEIHNGPVFSGFRVALEYLAYFPADTLIVSDEIWDVRIYPLATHYLIDWQISHRCKGPDTLFVDEYHYGGAAFRGSEAWNLESGAYDSLVYFVTAEGKTQSDGNHTRPQWVSMHGITDNGYGGIVLIQHPANFRYPQTVRVHPVMPYFCYAPMVQGAFVLAPGETYESRYRFLVFDGKPDLPLVEATVHSWQQVP